MPKPPVVSCRLADHRDQLVGRADDRRAGAVGAAAGRALEQVPRVLDGHGAGPAERPDVVLVVPAVQAVHGLAPRLLACPRRGGTTSAPASRRGSTVEPCCAAASSAKPHCVGRALMPSVELEAIDSTPMPYLPASCMPDGEIDDATAIGISSCSGQDLQLGVVELEPVALVVEAVVAAQQADDDAERLVLAVAQQHRVDAVGAGVGRQGAGTGAEDRPAPRHVVELDHPLGDVERVVVRAG